MSDDDEKETVYYYSREHRLSRASPGVRAMNDGKPIRPGFRGTLFATRGNVILFLVIILFFGFVLAYNFTGRDMERGVKFGKNKLALVINLTNEEIPVLGIVKNAPKSGEFYTGAVDIAVSPVLAKKSDVGEDTKMPPVFLHRIVFNPVESEMYRFSLPFEGTDFIVILKTEEEQKTMKIKAKSDK